MTEVCVLYRRRLEFPTPDGVLLAKQWLRYEWQRAGLRLSDANRACGVANAATRKYLTQDWLWYFPPPEMMQRLVDYANRNGPRVRSPLLLTRQPTSAHCRGVGGATAPVVAHARDHQRLVRSAAQRQRTLKGNGMRAAPRVHRPGPNAAVHLNQKPLDFMRRILDAASEPGDVVWEPFGGLCSAMVAAVEMGRIGHAAERVDRFADLAADRLSALRA